ncbi:MAG: amidohydrolase family protein [Bacteroidales bacterium]|nr:amidohydrolase family protein [Bacteroidales bacterium]MCF8390607.1 amidohydrolase family protein [Bacteroidales bacterium]
MIIKPTDLFSGNKIPVELSDDVFSDILRDELEGKDLFIAPGLIDLQVNGYKGVDFNDEKLSVNKIEQVVYELLKDGVTGFLPTLITNNPLIIEQNLKLFNLAIKKNPILKESILGIHLEGPFISSFKGAIGAHPIKWIQKPDIQLVNRWQKLSGGRIKLITLSPEYEGTEVFIKEIIAADIKVSIGHTNASIEQIREAVNAGASLSTHLGNAISSQIHRHVNILFEQMANDNLFASIITDGHHLPKELIKIILRSKPGKVILVSDSTKFSGMQSGIYETLIGGEVELKENKRLSIVGNDEYLAGSASKLFDCVNFLIKEKILSPEKAWEMASLIPYNYLFIKNSPSQCEDSVVFSYHGSRIKVHFTLKAGKLFF